MSGLETLNLAFAMWSTASALGVATLGIASLAGGKSRPRGGLAFGLFGLTWGVQILLGVVASFLTDAGLATFVYASYLALLLPLPFFLVEFVTAQAETPGRSATILRAVFAATACAGSLTLLFARDLVFVGVVPSFDAIFPVWGPLFVPLVQIPLFGAFAYALWSLHGLMRRSATRRIAERASMFVAGMGVYVGFASSNNLVFFLLSGSVPVPGTTLLIATLAAVTVTSLVIGFRALQDARLARSGEQRRHRLVAAAILIPLSLGAVEGALSARVYLPLNTVGLWRLAGVGIIAYGLATWRTYDLPQRTRRVAASMGGAMTAATGGVATYGVAAAALGGALVPALAGIAVAGASLVPSIRFMKRLVGRGVSDARAAEERLYGQRIDTYRAALEAALARGTLGEDEEFLAALRTRFGISNEEDRVLRYYAKSAVLVPRDGATGAYERLRLLGEGGGGRTWLARDRARDRLVVLKEPLQRWQREPSLKDAVVREARLAARVRHPNVVAIEEVIEQDGFPVIVMEYLDGGTLSDLLESRGTLPWKEAASLMVETLRGVEAVHGAGVVHRDVKPSNILLTSDGVPKIGDFGVALVPNVRKTVVDVSGPFGTAVPISTPDSDTLNTVRAGTPIYMAPEVRSGASLGDRRADVYACAAVLHECICGAPPTPGAAVVNRDDVPPALLALLARGLAAKPEQRIPTARAFAEELSRLVKP